MKTKGLEMMYSEAEAIDGIQYAIHEVDLELISLIPNFRRRACTPRVMEEADRLLDIRNYLGSIAAEINYDEMARMMTT